MQMPEKKHSPKWCSIYDGLRKRGHSKESAAKIASSKVDYALEDIAEMKAKIVDDSIDTAKEIEEMIAKYADTDGNNLIGIEVMSTGTWKGVKFTEADLDAMVDNFGKIKVRPALKIGHPDDQKFAQREGRPAFGWITSLKRVGQKLFADISDVPEKLVGLIQKRHWTRFSSEVRLNYPYMGNVYGKVLSGVALLGEEWPAVNTLDDIYDLHSASAANYSEDWAGDGQILFTDPEGGKKEMDKIEEMQAKLDEMAKANVKLSEENKAFQAKTTELEAEAQKAKAEAQKTLLYSEIDAGIKAMKIPPASREVVAALAFKAAGLIEDKHTFSDNGKTVVMEDDVAGLIKKLSDALPEVGNTEPKSRDDKQKTNTQAKEGIQEGGRKYFTGEDLDEKISAYMKENKVSYSEAYDAVGEQMASDQE